MPKLFFILLLIPSLRNSANVDHAIYLSVIEIDHRKEIDKAKISIKVFTNDLHDCIKNFSSSFKAVDDLTLIEKNQTIVEDYFQEHLKISINTIHQYLSLQSWQQENDAYFLYFDISCPKKWQTVDLKADYFMELFPQQSNIISIYDVDEKYFHRTTKSQPHKTFTFFSH
ncbi:MAG: hypothetical protein OEY34_09450 [Cyclobacteriaceae bacterium]|nr:hypothetical protein [Cyclobacteriaceae bacterium]